MLLLIFFSTNNYKSRSKLSTHEHLILTEFHNHWVKIVDFLIKANVIWKSRLGWPGLYFLGSNLFYEFLYVINIFKIIFKYSLIKVWTTYAHGNITCNERHLNFPLAESNKSYLILQIIYIPRSSFEMGACCLRYEHLE